MHNHDSASSTTIPDGHRYDAFISYRHVEPDRSWAKWLHGALETYRVPRQLVAEGYPKRLTRVFRDEEELPANADLSSQITAALDESRFLIVVCSPRAVESRWVNAEVEHFRKLGRHDRILALLIEGEPAASFPKALVEIRSSVVDAASDGTTSTREVIEDVEPLAADVRPERRLADFLTVLGRARAGVGFDAERFTLAESNLLEAHTIHRAAEDRGPAHEATLACGQGLVDLYSAWHAAEPDKGYDAKAAEWKAKLDAATTDEKKPAAEAAD